MKQTKPKRSILPFLIGGLALETAAIAAYIRIVRPWFLQWGASDQEVQRALPGDEIVVRPVTGYTRAITIQAPIHEVWQWVVQIGENRGGLYVNEWLAKSLGAEMHNAERILPEFQDARVGDYVLLYPNGPGYAVAAIDAPRSLVLQTVSLETGEFTTSVGRNGVHGTLAFLLEPQRNNKTRLVVRMRLDYEPHPLYRTAWGMVEPLNFFMERQLMRGIKVRAESHRVKDELLDQVLPEYEFRGAESIEIRATPEQIFRAAKQVTLADVPLAQVMGDLRYLPERIAGRLPGETHPRDSFMDSILSNNILLAQQTDREIVVGSIAKFHDMFSREPVPLHEPEEFRRFHHAAYQKLAMSLRVVPASDADRATLLLEYRTHAMSELSRSQFGVYWLAVKPASNLVARQLLHAIQSLAEAPASVTTQVSPGQPPPKQETQS